MQHDVHAVHGAWGERPAAATAGAAQMGVEVVDVGGGQLGDGYVAQMGIEMAADEAAGLTDRGHRPVRRGRGEPSLQQVGDRPGVGPCGLCLVDQQRQLGLGVATAAVDRASGPSLLSGVGVRS